ncbi:hypothetical protein K438DRAFT_1777196 [Mycena galopus ATCC 62051]|nr:hypothetical protein K438DRAFT_1777196 [Mycena galopus ATCC 62051]
MTLEVDELKFQLSDRPLEKKLLAELLKIAEYLQIDLTQLPKVLKPAVLGLIKDHRQAHPEIADDPRLLPLFGHRNPPQTVGRNSAGKAAEDEMETSKPPTDPPAQFGRLQLAHSKSNKISSPKDMADESDSTASDRTPPPRNCSPLPDLRVQKIEHKQDMSGLIQVNFLDQTNHSVAHHQVFVDDVPITVATAEDGQRKYTALLSQLLPAAIQNDSPIKELGGRVYRPNIRNESTHHHIGRIDSLLTSSSHALLTRQMNEYALQPSAAGGFVYDVFWEPEPLGAEGVGLEIKRNASPLRFTGTGSDVPLDIVNSRAESDPMHAKAAPGLRDKFSVFLHDQAGQMLDQRLLQQAVFEFFAGWGRTGGGFVVPAGHADFSGVIFKKDFIHEVLYIKSSSTSDIDKWCAPELLEKAPKAKAWVNSKSKMNDTIFRNMKSARFKEYLQEYHRKSRKVRRRSSGSRSPGRTHKHQKSASVDQSDSEDEHGSGRRGDKRRTSENLDE